MGRVLYWARRYDQAIEQYRRMIELNPSFASNHLFLGLVYVQKEMYTEAIAEMQKGLELRQNPTTPTFLAYAYAVAGRRDEAREILGELERKNVSAGYTALVYTGLGEKDKALAWLDKAYDAYDSWLFQLQDPLWDPLRDDPRFKDLLRRLNLPVQNTYGG